MLILHMLCLRWRWNWDQIASLWLWVWYPLMFSIGLLGSYFNDGGNLARVLAFRAKRSTTLGMHFQLQVPCAETSSSRHRIPHLCLSTCVLWPHLFLPLLVLCLRIYAYGCKDNVLPRKTREFKQRDGDREKMWGTEKAPSGGRYLHLLHGTQYVMDGFKASRYGFHLKQGHSFPVKSSVSASKENNWRVIPPLKKPWEKWWSPKAGISYRRGL